jgi:hypothetical protein
LFIIIFEAAFEQNGRVRQRDFAGENAEVGGINAVPEAAAPMSSQKRLASAGINLLK